MAPQPPASIGAGAFTGCHHIKALSVSLLKGKASLLRDVLMEVAEELVVSLEMPEGKASLLFPAYFEEGVENTPARIIEHHTHGSGLLFRNCFVSRELQFLEYDKRFADARGEEGEELLLRLALGRLRFPLHLEKASKEAYEAYLGEHFEAALDLTARQRDTATSAFLMEWKHRGKAGRKKREDFSL
ncbi:MAG: hypothetical protein IIZ39_10135 [Blautia sp.]|nr:hypothetical protein [Blautia sp.]